MSSPDSWLENAIIFGVYPGSGGGGGGVTPRQVQEFAFNYEPATGVNDAFVVILTPPVIVLTDGLIVSMSTGPLQNNTDSPTLQVNALTPVPIVLWGGALAPGDIEPNASYLFIYNEASNTFQLINPSITTASTFLVQGNSYNNAIDSGAIDAYAVTLLVPPAGSFGVGFPIYMKVAPAHDNTGASTLTVNGVTDAIILNNGSALSAGMLVGNQLAYLLYNGADWVLMNPATTGTGFVQSVSGANVKQVIVDNTDPENPILSTPQDIATDSDVTFNSLTSTADSLVNNKTIGTGGGNQFSNTVFGIEAMFSNVDGDNCVAIGDNALRSNVSGVQSVAVGVNAAVAATGGLLTAIGDQALADNVAGAGNTAVGALAGQGIVSGNFNSTFGAGSGVSDDATAGALALGANSIADPASGVTAADNGPGVALGSSAYPVGFRGDGTPYPAGAADYWRAKINNNYYKVPLLPDATDLEWPAGPGTLALLSDIPGGGGLAWQSVAGTSQACAVNNGYIALNVAQTTFSLPATAAVGSVIAVQGHGAGGWIVNANGGQTIAGGSEVSTSGGSVASQAGIDNVYLLCVVADTEWRITSAYSQGLTYS